MLTAHFTGQDWCVVRGGQWRPIRQDCWCPSKRAQAGDANRKKSDCGRIKRISRAMLGVGEREQEGGVAVEDASLICLSTCSCSSVHNPPTHPSTGPPLSICLPLTSLFTHSPTPSTCPSQLVGLPAPTWLTIYLSLFSPALFDHTLRKPHPCDHLSTCLSGHPSIRPPALAPPPPPAQVLTL